MTQGLTFSGQREISKAEEINGSIDRINEINSAYPGIRPVSHVINFLEIR
jgi:hypothetical protein